MTDTGVAASLPAPARTVAARSGWRSSLKAAFAHPAFPLLIAALGVEGMTTFAFPNLLQLHRAALWGVVLLVSFAGWGALVAQLAAPGQPADLGLRLSWGMAAVVAIGGFACLAALANRWVLFGLVLAGCALEGWHLWARRERESPRLASAVGWRATTTMIFLMVGILAGLQYYGAATAARLQSDDFQSYLVFPQKILNSGTLLDMFSMRRLAAYGGQSLLHALVLAGVGNPMQVSLFDGGISVLIVLALAVGDRARAAIGLWVLPVLLLLTLANVRANSTSVMSGVVIFLALYKTASSPARARHPLRCAALLGMLAAVAASLRQPYIVPAVAFMVLLYAPVAIRAVLRPGERRQGLAEVGIAAATLLAVLLPWALLSYRSSGTLLFPLFDGYYHPEYGRLTGSNPDVERAEFLWENLRHCHPVHTVPLFLLAALWIPWRRTRGALPALTVASILGFVAIVWAFPQSDEWSIARYYFGFVTATVVAVSTYVCSLSLAEWWRNPLRLYIPALLTVIALLLQLGAAAQESADDYREFAYRVGMFANRATSPIAPDPAYGLLQARLPVDATAAVMLDRPFWFDFGRNHIEVMDLPGNVSPPPGLPLDDDDALSEYFIANGIRYLVFVRSTQSESVFLRRGWEQMLGPPPSPLWGNAAPLFLKTFDRFESLINSRIRLYDDDKMVVLDLTRRIGPNAAPH